MGYLVIGCFAFVNTHSLVAGKFPGMEPHVGFWDAPKPGGTPNRLCKTSGFLVLSLLC